MTVIFSLTSGPFTTAAVNLRDRLLRSGQHFAVSGDTLKISRALQRVEERDGVVIDQPFPDRIASETADELFPKANVQVSAELDLNGCRTKRSGELLDGLRLFLPNCD